MHNSKLIRYLSALDEKEHRQFHKYLVNNTTDQHLHRLNTRLLQIRPTWDSKHLEASAIIGEVFGKQPATINRLRKLMTKLLHTLEDFWVVESALNDEHYRNHVVRNTLLIKKKYRLYQNESQNQVKHLESKKIKDINTLEALHKIYEEWSYEYQNLNNITLTSSRSN